MTKPNPKQAFGCKKVSVSALPIPVLLEVAMGMKEGDFKYGRHNFRVTKIVESEYYDATMRHILDYMEGTDIDPDSGVHHLSKAIASLMVWRDAQIFEMTIDDRPPKSPKTMVEMNKVMVKLRNKYPNPKPPITQKDLKK